jgi:hypothetical protein
MFIFSKIDTPTPTSTPTAPTVELMDFNNATSNRAMATVYRIPVAVVAPAGQSFPVDATDTGLDFSSPDSIARTASFTRAVSDTGLAFSDQGVTRSITRVVTDPGLVFSESLAANGSTARGGRPCPAPLVQAGARASKPSRLRSTRRPGSSITCGRRSGCHLPRAVVETVTRVKR